MSDPRKKPTFVAGIRSTFWRRVAIVVVMPPLVIWHLRLLLLLLPLALVREAGLGAWRGVADYLGEMVSLREMRALRLGLSAMWSRAWADDSAAAIDAAGRRLRGERA